MSLSTHGGTTTTTTTTNTNTNTNTNPATPRHNPNPNPQHKTSNPKSAKNHTSPIAWPTHHTHEPDHPHPQHDPRSWWPTTPTPMAWPIRRDPYTTKNNLRRKRENLRRKRKIFEKKREEEKWDSRGRLRDTEGQKTKKREKKGKY